MITAEDFGVTGATNFRDVGGLPVAGGRQTRSGVLFRSGNLAALDDGGRARLRELGIRRIVDLREDQEIEHAPSLLGDVPVETVRVPLLVGSVRSFMQADTGLAGMYRALVEMSGDRLVDVARGVLEGAPALVHCTVGKDRTGVSVALLLAAIDVDRDAIVANYARTEELLSPERNAQVMGYLRTVHPDAQSLEELVTRSPGPVIRELLEQVDAEYGSAAVFLRSHGLTDDELEALRTLLVAEARQT